MNDAEGTTTFTVEEVHQIAKDAGINLEDSVCLTISGGPRINRNQLSLSQEPKLPEVTFFVMHQ